MAPLIGRPDGRIFSRVTAAAAAEVRRTAEAKWLKSNHSRMADSKGIFSLVYNVSSKNLVN
jgi:hypothetical protein